MGPSARGAQVTPPGPGRLQNLLSYVQRRGPGAAPGFRPVPNTGARGPEGIVGITTITTITNIITVVCTFRIVDEYVFYLSDVGMMEGERDSCAFVSLGIVSSRAVLPPLLLLL